jgi:hypothetical protein
MSFAAEKGSLPQQATASGESARPQSAGAHRSSRDRLRWWVVLLITWLIAGVYAGSYLKRGWVPHDEGAFAQSADRVLHGELPHRDYNEIYTGGLAYLNALAFRYLGENLGTLRIVLFVFFLLWVPVFYWIASRLVVDWHAGGITLLAVAWSLPNYSAAVPSWYNLFFATFGLAALLSYLDKRSSTWLFVAGFCGGLSLLAKSTALYYVAAVLLFFLFYEQNLSRSRAGPEKPRRFLYTSFVALSMSVFVAALAVLVWPHASVERFLNFVFPSVTLATVVLVQEERSMRRPNRERFLEMLRVCIPFGLGFLVPVSAFLLLYIRESALHAVVNGTFVVPSKRLWGAFMDPPNIATIAPSLCLAGVLAVGAWLRGTARWVLVFVAGLATAYYLISSAHDTANYQAAWHAAYWLTPFLCLIGGFILWRETRGAVSFEDSIGQQQMFLILAVSSLCSLVQYPFSAQIYFCYSAPLVILGTVAILALFPSIPRALLAVVFVGFLLFAVFRVTPPFIYAMGLYDQPDPETQVLDLARAGGLRIEARSVEIYKRLIPLIQQHAGAAEIYAAPDCPEIYFLSGYRNPTPALFDFLEDDYGDSERLLRLVDRRPIRVVVVNENPSFSEALPPDVVEALMNRFPEGESIGDFQVLWRD